MRFAQVLREVVVVRIPGLRFLQARLIEGDTVEITKIRTRAAILVVLGFGDRSPESG